jgi:hypothetical protein
VTFKAVCETEVAELEPAILDQHVGRLDVAVDDLPVGEVLAGQADFVDCEGPVEMGVAVNTALEGSALAILGDDVVVVLGVVKIHEFEYVGMVRLF